MAVARITSKCAMQKWLSKTLAFQISLARQINATTHKSVSIQTRHVSRISYFPLIKLKQTSESTKRLLSTDEPVDLNHDDDDVSLQDDSRKSKFKDKKMMGTNILGSVGRFIPHDILDVIDADGEKHIGITRKKAMNLSQDSNLKLVLINAKSKPNATYRLMSGAELHQERMKNKETHEKEKKPTETKELTIFENIGQHDLEIKKKQIQRWMEKSEHEYHVLIKVINKRTAVKEMPVDGKMKLINAILEGLNEVTMNGPPKKFGKNGEGLRVMLRHMSAKEKAKHRKENQ